MASSAFRRAVEVLERAHRLALILLVGPNDGANEAREQLANLLPPELQARSYRIDRQGPDILSFAESLADPFPILFVHGFERIHSEQREDVEIRLNLLRDAFAQHHLGLVFWLPKETLESFLQHCPDLFAWRSLLAEVDGSDLPISPIIATRRKYLSHLLRQTRLPEVLVEVHVADADGASLPIGFQAWAVRTKRGLVVGAAGSGKTTALRMLAHRFANHAYDDVTQPVPVLLHVGAFSPSSRFDADQIWPREIDRELPPPVLSTLAETGQLMLLIDGLDEVYPSARGPLLDWIIQLTNMYPLLRMIVATRILEPALLAGLSHEWEVVHMQELTREQARELAGNLLRHYGVTSDQWIDSFTNDLAISRYPLFVRLLVSNYQISGHLRPEGQRRLALDRVRFLSDLVDLRLRDFDQATSSYRGIGQAQRADVLGYQDLRRALQRVALAAMVGETPRISRDMLLSSFSEIPGLFSTEAVRENAQYILISRSGLLQEKAGYLIFVHMSIQEYLAAEYLVYTIGTQELEILDTHIADPRWSEVVAYTVALAVKRGSHFGRALLDTLALRALRISEAGSRAASFATLLSAGLGADIWSETIGSVLQAARLMLENPSDATYALEPVVGEAMHLHSKVD